MSSHGVGLGPSKKGRTADSSMVTRNVKIVAQGQADATYASTQKKNPFRLYSAIMNGDAYSASVMALNNLGVNRASIASISPFFIDLFSTFTIANWQLNNSQNATSPIVGIQMMPVLLDPGAGRASSFYKTPFDLTRSFSVIATFLTQTSPGTPPLDGFTVAFAANSSAIGSNGGGLGISGDGNTVPVVAVALKPLTSNNTFLLRENTIGTPSGSPVLLGGIGNKIELTNNLEVTVEISYNPSVAGGTLSWSIRDDAFPPAAPVTNVYTNVSLSTLLGVNNGYLGCSAGAGDQNQPVFLIGMSFAQ